MHRGRQVFSFALLLVLIFFVVGAFEYRGAARVIPLVVGIPTMILAGLLLALELVPSWSNRWLEEPQLLAQAIGSVAAQSLPERTRRETRDEPSPGMSTPVIFAWFVALLVSFLLLGYLWGVPLFVFLFLSFQARTRLRTSASIAAGIWLLLYAIFVSLLRVPA